LARLTVMDADDDNPTFWKLLNGNKASIKSKADAKAAEDAKEDFVNKLYRVSDRQSGQMTITEVASGKFTKSQLDSNDVFLVDTELRLFIWIGKQCDAEEKKNAFKVANEHLVSAGRPLTTACVRVLEEAHNEAFEAAFTVEKKKK